MSGVTFQKCMLFHFRWHSLAPELQVPLRWISHILHMTSFPTNGTCNTTGSANLYVPFHVWVLVFTKKGPDLGLIYLPRLDIEPHLRFSLWLGLVFDFLCYSSVSRDPLSFMLVFSSLLPMLRCSLPFCSKLLLLSKNHKYHYPESPYILHISSAWYVALPSVFLSQVHHPSSPPVKG